MSQSFTEIRISKAEARSAEKSLKPDAGSERKVTVVVQHARDPAGRVPWVPGGWPWIV